MVRQSSQSGLQFRRQLRSLSDKPSTGAELRHLQRDQHRGTGEGFFKAWGLGFRVWGVELCSQLLEITLEVESHAGMAHSHASEGYSPENFVLKTRAGHG